MNKIFTIIILLLLTSCVGIGVFHKSNKLKNDVFPFGFECFKDNNKNYKHCFPRSVRKKDLIKKLGAPYYSEKVGENEEKLVYKSGFGWSGINIMLGIPIPIGIPTYKKNKYFYFKNDDLLKAQEECPELFGIWCGFSGGKYNEKTKKTEWLECVAKFK